MSENSSTLFDDLISKPKPKPIVIDEDKIFDEQGKLKLLSYGLSPTAINSWYNYRPDYIRRYFLKISGSQTFPMAVGSAFDVIVKNYLAEKLFGIKEKFGMENLNVNDGIFTNEMAIKEGQRCFDFYRSTGSLVDLIVELDYAMTEPRMELEIKDYIDGCLLVGRPDIYFIAPSGHHVVYDWKVTGKKSPNKHYIMCRPNGKRYKDDEMVNKGGFLINKNFNLEDVDPVWASQITIYAWILGEDIGAEFIAGIDQLLRHIDRVASFRCLISKGYQIELLDKIKKMWEDLNNITVSKIYDEIEFLKSTGEWEE